jgi:hypothetical protein
LYKTTFGSRDASTPWISLFPSFSLRHLPNDSSDHNPLILDTAVSQLSLPKPFRFEEFWIKHPDCLSIIVAAWAFYVSRSPTFILIKKLKSTKHALKIWNNLSFGNIQKKKKINYLSHILDDIQQSAMTSDLCKHEIDIRVELDSLYHQEEILWKLKNLVTLVSLAKI